MSLSQKCVHSMRQIFWKATVVCSSSPQKAESISLPLQSGLRHRSCFDQWDIGKQHEQRIKKYTVGFSLSYCWETLRIHWNKFRLASYRKKDHIVRSSRHPVISVTSAMPTEHLDCGFSTFRCQHSYWHLESNDSLSWRAILCIARGWAGAIASTH